MRSSTTLQPDDGGQRNARIEPGPVPGNAAQAGISDDSPRIAAQRSMAEAIQNSPRVAAGHERGQALTGGGLPAQLKAGVEALSGLSMDGVRVHYNSARPAQLSAHAYAQGADIHLGPGQERHLPHEAWHVVQQARGRVRPTLQAKGLPVNDDQQLEREADRMGELALGLRPDGAGGAARLDALTVPQAAAAPLQRAKEEADPPDGEPVDIAHATQVGVQLTIDGEDKVASVLVAGRPRSPFTGTMGDHVTAFGVHVLNLRKAMQGKPLDAAYGGLHALIAAMWALPGIAYVPDGEAEWHVRRAQLQQADGWQETAPADARLAHLQWLAALYLEVREGIPLSLVNTRSVTAKAGRGRGEAKLLARLSAYEPDDPSTRVTKKTRKTKGGSVASSQAPADVAASDEEIEIALGLFDEDAAALLTFNHEVKNTDGVGRMMPGHADPATLGATDNAKLMGQLARQHVASVFPLAGEKSASLEKAVLDKLLAAHALRKSGDGFFWHGQLASAGVRVLNASRNGVNKDWLKAYAGAAVEDVFTAFDYLIKLVEFVVPDTRKDERDEVLKALATHVEALESELDAAYEVAQLSSVANGRGVREALRDYFGGAGAAFSLFFHAFRMEVSDSAQAQQGSVARLAAGALPKDALARLVRLLGEAKTARETAEVLLEAPQAPALAVASSAVRDDETMGVEAPEKQETARKDLKRKAEDEESKEPEPDAGTRLARMDVEARRRIVVRLGRQASSPNLERSTADDRVNSIVGELSSSIGNSFTVALRLDQEGKIGAVSLRGRPPSPFRSSMGAHATAWLVWVNAVNRQLTGATLDVAGWRLVEMARYLLADAAEQKDAVLKAQNGSRRNPARWNPASLAAWGARLATYVKVDQAWTVNRVQGFAQAILTFANQLPGTTRANKNTDGHGEADAWKKVKEDYLNPDTRDAALEGPGLFDASPNSSVRKRHLWLMKLALGHPID